MRLNFQRLRAREAWLRVHFYLGHGLGLFFVLLGLTGSLSMFRDDLDTWFNPELVISSHGDAYLPLDKLMSAARAVHPSRHNEWIVETPSTPDHAMTLWYEKPHETFDEYYAPLMVSVNPYTGEILASRFWGQTAASRISDLHTRLLAGAFGSHLVGWLGLLLSGSLVTGLYLWWPGRKALQDALRLRSDAGLSALAFDVHRSIGFAFAIPLLILAMTGAQLAFPQLLETLTSAEGMGHGDTGPEIRSTALPNNHPVSLNEAALIARGLFPHAQARSIATPAGETGTYRVHLRQPDEPNLRHPATVVWVDRWSGQIRDARNPKQFTRGQAYLNALWPLHTGERWGGSGKLLWFVAGFIPLLLYATSLSRWLIRHGWLPERDVSAWRQLAVDSGIRMAHGALAMMRRAQPLAYRLLTQCAQIWRQKP